MPKKRDADEQTPRSTAATEKIETHSTYDEFSRACPAVHCARLCSSLATAVALLQLTVISPPNPPEARR